MLTLLVVYSSFSPKVPSRCRIEISARSGVHAIRLLPVRSHGASAAPPVAIRTVVSQVLLSPSGSAPMPLIMFSSSYVVLRGCDVPGAYHRCVVAMCQDVCRRCSRMRSGELGRRRGRGAAAGRGALCSPHQRCPATPASTPYDVILKLGAYKAFSEMSPVLQFVHITCVQAVLDHLRGAGCIDILDLYIAMGEQ